MGMEFQSTTDTRPRSRPSLASDPENLLDPANAFSVRITQVFFGPVELQLVSDEVPFHIRKGRGSLEVVVRDGTGHKNALVVDFAHISQITLKRNESRTSSQVAIACHLSHFAGKKMIANLQKIEELQRLLGGQGTLRASNLYLIKQLILILKPLDQQRNWMFYKISPNAHHPLSRLEHMLQNWVYKVGNRQTCLEDTNTEIPTYFDVISLDNWMNYLSDIGLMFKPYTTPKGEIDLYYSVGFDKSKPKQQSAPQLHQNKTNNTGGRPINEMRQAMPVHQKTIQTKHNKNQGVENTSPRQGGPFAQLMDSKTSPKRPVSAVLNARYVSPPRKKAAITSPQQQNSTTDEFPAPEKASSVESTSSTDSSMSTSSTLSSSSSDELRLPSPTTGSKKSDGVGKTTPRSMKKKQATECILLELDDEEDGKPTVAPAPQPQPKQGSSKEEEEVKKEVEETPPVKKTPTRTKKAPPINGGTKLVDYPIEGQSSRAIPSVSVIFDDVRYLAHQEMLNDTIIEFWLKYIVCELVKPEMRSKIHIFNTFFFPNITGVVNGMAKHPRMAFHKGEKAGQIRYNWVKGNFNKVKNWTKRMNIFDKDYVVVPVNEEMHWYIVIIVNPRKAIVPKREENLAASRAKGASRPDPDSYIVVLDSLMDTHDHKRQCIADLIRDYLEIEFEDKKPMPGELERTRLGLLRPCHLPKQTNFFDCGVYLLEYVELFLTKPPTIGPTEVNCWDRWYPESIYRLAYKRQTILSKLRHLAGKETWRNLKLFEKQIGRGVTVDTLEAAIEKSRRTRYPSESLPREAIRLRGRPRRNSDPPDVSKAGPSQQKNVVCIPQEWQEKTKKKAVKQEQQPASSVEPEAMETD